MQVSIHRRYFNMNTHAFNIEADDSRQQLQVTKTRGATSILEDNTREGWWKRLFFKTIQ